MPIERDSLFEFLRSTGTGATVRRFCYINGNGKDKLWVLSSHTHYFSLFDWLTESSFQVRCFVEGLWNSPLMQDFVELDAEWCWFGVRILKEVSSDSLYGVYFIPYERNHISTTPTVKDYTICGGWIELQFLTPINVYRITFTKGNHFTTLNVWNKQCLLHLLRFKFIQEV